MICVAVIPAALNGCTAFVLTGKPPDNEETALSSAAEIPPGALVTAPPNAAEVADSAEAPQSLTATAWFVLAICHQPLPAAATVPLIAFSWAPTLRTARWLSDSAPS